MDGPVESVCIVGEADPALSAAANTPEAAGPAGSGPIPSGAENLAGIHYRRVIAAWPIASHDESSTDGSNQVLSRHAGNIEVLHISAATRRTSEGHSREQSTQQGTVLAEEPILLRICGEGCASLDRASEIGIQLSQVIGKPFIVILHLSPSVLRLSTIDTYPCDTHGDKNKERTTCGS